MQGLEAIAEYFTPRVDRVGLGADVDFDTYIMRITDEGGDVVPGADNVTTLPSASSYAGVFSVGRDVSVSSLTDDDRVFSNVRINDGGKISVAIHNLSSLPFTARNPVTPSSQGLSFVAVDSIPLFGVAARKPNAHRDFPIDVLASDETYKFTAWAVNDSGEVISPVASLTVRPIDKKANISSITDYANPAPGAQVTNVYVTEFTVFK